MTSAELLSWLDAAKIAYEKIEHPAVFTCEQARELVPKISATQTKNLFLRDKPGTRHFLVSVPEQKSVDINALGELLQAKKLGFASADRLQKHLGVEPGSVSLLALINDPSFAVETIIDEEVWNATAVGCHPLINTATLILQQQDLRKFFSSSGHSPQVMPIPSR